MFEYIVVIYDENPEHDWKFATFESFVSAYNLIQALKVIDESKGIKYKYRIEQVSKWFTYNK